MATSEAMARTRRNVLRSFPAISGWRDLHAGRCMEDLGEWSFRVRAGANSRCFMGTSKAQRRRRILDTSRAIWLAVGRIYNLRRRYLAFVGDRALSPFRSEGLTRPPPAASGRKQPVAC